MDIISEKVPFGNEHSFDGTFLVNLYGIVGGSLTSEYKTSIPSLKYSISIYPFGKTQDQSGQTWIYLNFQNQSDSEYTTNFKITVESANLSVKKSQVLERSKEWKSVGIFCCSSIEICKSKFIYKRKMVIKIDGILKAATNKSWKFCKNSDFLSLALWEQECKDFTISVNGKKITAHKCVLAARSPVFARMFESGLKEARESKVEIKEFAYEIVEVAVKLCYHHTLVGEISMENKFDLLQFFDKYDIQSLKEELEEHLITQISELNIIKLINVSLYSNSVKLEQKCSKFLRKCLNNSTPIHDFDQLDKDFALNFLKNSFCHS